MNSSVSDEVLVNLAQDSYSDKEFVKVRIGNHEEVWNRVEIPTSVPLHNRKIIVYMDSFSLFFI